MVVALALALALAAAAAAAAAVAATDTVFAPAWTGTAGSRLPEDDSAVVF